MRKIIFVSIASFFIFGLIGFSWANMCGGHMAEAQSTQESTTNQKAINVGNKICPVSGEKIEEKTKATYEYQGKVYNFCCPMCIEEFKKDPQKYIEKIEQQKQAESKEQKTDNKTSTSQDAHTGHQH
ncbi:MAG: YHS domain-containing protein [Candidatus Omnitrophota bacterium]